MAVSEHKGPAIAWVGPARFSGFSERIRAGPGALSARYLGEQNRWFLWTPVALGLGIALYFSFGDEPGWAIVATPLVVGILVAWWLGASRAGAFSLSLVVAIAGMGMVLAKSRVQFLQAPVLSSRIGPVTVEGWVETLQLRPSGRIAAVIIVDRIERLDAEKTPAKVQVTMARSLAPDHAGENISVLAMLRPPPRPVAPGAYDFARRAYFRQIGAYGYSLARPKVNFDGNMTAQPWSRQFSLWVNTIRTSVAERVRNVVSASAAEYGGDRGGAVAAALLTGLRGGISKSDLEAIRDAGLAHLLAISGLHMALMSGAAFWAVRALIALFPWLAVRIVSKKWAAGAGLSTGFVYFFLAGGSVATERAFIMVAVALVAVMLDRPAISMRNVAVAALAILTIKPDSLTEAGFQMSFSAVVALTAFYEWLARQKAGYEFIGEDDHRQSIAGFVVKVLAGVLLTTLIASLATGPLAAFQFGRVAVFGLAANLVAVPLVGFVVMPLGLAALVLMPLGLDGPALALMGAGTGALIQIAHSVAGWPGAAVLVASPPSAVLPLFALGGLWLCLWRGSWRYWGLSLVVVSFALCQWPQVPDILIGEDGKRIAVRMPDGRLALSGGRGGRYAAGQWLRRDADGRTIRQASVRNDTLTCDARACVATLGGNVGESGRAGKRDKNVKAGISGQSSQIMRDSPRSSAGSDKSSGSSGSGRSGEASTSGDNVDQRSQVKQINTAGRTYDFAYIRHPAALAEECAGAHIVVSTIPLYRRCRGPQITIDRFDLYRNGAHAIRFEAGGPTVTTVAQTTGNRPWNRFYKPR